MVGDPPKRATDSTWNGGIYPVRNIPICDPGGFTQLESTYTHREYTNKGGIKEKRKKKMIRDELNQERGRREKIERMINDRIEGSSCMIIIQRSSSDQLRCILNRLIIDE